MALLTIPAKRKIEGPWLVGVEELESLDNVLELINNKLSAALEIQINETVLIEDEKNNLSEDSIKDRIEQVKSRHSFKKFKKKVILSSIDDKKLSDKSLSSILKDPKIIEFFTREISAAIEHGINNVFDLKLSASNKGKLTYQLSCFDQEIENEIRYEIDKWIDKHKPNKILQIWSNHSDILSILFFIISLLTLGMLFPTSSDAYKEENKTRMHELLKKGITKENQQQAMELILSHESDYTPKNYVATVVANKATKLKVFFISTLLFSFSIIRPKTTIGIGRRKTLLNFYKIWWKLVLVTSPITFIINPLIELLKRQL